MTATNYDMVSNPDQVSIDRFVDEAEPVVRNLIASLCANNPGFRDCPPEDLLAAARVAVVEVYRNYDPARANDGVKPYLILQVGWAIRREANIINGGASGMKPRRWAQRLEILRWKAAYTAAHGAEPDRALLAAEFGMTEDRVIAIINAPAPVSDEDAMLMVSDDSDAPDDATETALMVGKVRAWAVRTLGARDADIFISATAHGELQVALGNRYGLTSERVRQIILRATEKARAAFGDASAA